MAIPWQSWDRQLTCTPSAHFHPASLAELQSTIAACPIVRVCAKASHSYSPVATPDEAGASVSLDRLCLVTVDEEQGTVTAEAWAPEFKGRTRFPPPERMSAYF